MSDSWELEGDPEQVRRLSEMLTSGEPNRWWDAIERLQRLPELRGLWEMGSVGGCSRLMTDEWWGRMCRQWAQLRAEDVREDSEVGPGPAQQVSSLVSPDMVCFLAPGESLGTCNERGRSVGQSRVYPYDREWFDWRVEGLIAEKEKVWARTRQVYISKRELWVTSEILCAALCAHEWVQRRYYQSSTFAVDHAFRAMERSPVLSKEVVFVIAVMECERIKDIEAGVCAAENYLSWFIKNGTEVPWAYVEDRYPLLSVISLIAVR